MSDNPSSSTQPRKSLLRVTSLLMVSRGAGWLLGFAREVIIAALFGATRIVDAFAVATVLPVAIHTMLNNMFSSTLIPHYVSIKAEHGEPSARATVRAIMMQVFLVMITVAILVLVIAPQIIHWFAPQFGFDDSVQAIRFLRIVIAGIIGVSVFSVLVNVYQIHDKWARPALGPVFANSIGIALLVIGSMAFGADAIAWSWLTAFLIMPFVLLTGKTGRGYFGMKLSDPHSKAFYRIAVPVLFASLFGSVVQVINRYIASGLPEGELASLVYAQRVYLMCSELVMATLIPALFPRLAESAVDSSREQYADLLEKASLGVTLVTIGGAAILAGVALPIVEVAFERGAFTAVDSLRVAKILFVLSGALVFFIPLIIVYRAYFAARNSIVPTIGMFIGMCLDIFLCLHLVGTMGTPGLAVASICGLSSQFVLLIWVAQRYGVILPRRKLFWLFVRGLIAGIIVAVLLRGLSLYWESHILFLRIIRLAGLMGIGVLSFYVLAKILRLPGLDLIEGYIKAAWHRVGSSVSRPSASA